MREVQGEKGEAGLVLALFNAIWLGLLLITAKAEGWVWSNEEQLISVMKGLGSQHGWERPGPLGCSCSRRGMGWDGRMGWLEGGLGKVLEPPQHGFRTQGNGGAPPSRFTLTPVSKLPQQELGAAARNPGSRLRFPLTVEWVGGNPSGRVCIPEGMNAQH